MPRLRPTGPPELLAGYLALEGIEERVMARSLDRHTPSVYLWYRLLTLYNQGIRGDHEFGGADDELPAWSLRLGLFTVGLGTSKLALDAALGGYYAQSFMLLRHLLESWVQVRYARLLPAEATRWYALPDGTPRREPAPGTLRRFVRRLDPDRQLTAEVERMLKHLDHRPRPHIRDRGGVYPWPTPVHLARTARGAGSPTPTVAGALALPPAAR